MSKLSPTTDQYVTDILKTLVNDRLEGDKLDEAFLERLKETYDTLTSLKIYYENKLT